MTSGTLCAAFLAALVMATCTSTVAALVHEDFERDNSSLVVPSAASPTVAVQQPDQQSDQQPESDQGGGGGGGGGEERSLPPRSLMEKAHDLFIAMMYKSEIPGSPHKDYPIYAVVPKTHFKCSDHSNVGYYADIESGCQVIHICQADGTQESFLCPNGTIFNQQYFVCDWWFNVDCRESTTFYELNGGFGKVAEKNYYQEPTEKVAEKDYFQESRIVEIKH